MCNDSKSSKIESLHVITGLTQKLVLIRVNSHFFSKSSFIQIQFSQNPTLTPEQATTLLDALSIAIKAKPINSDKQRKQLLNLIQSFKKRFYLPFESREENKRDVGIFRFNLPINEELLNSLSNKRKSSPKVVSAKKAKISNGDEKQSIADCRQIPFQGIQK